ncbi:MAG: VWA domain-containing protein, partial [Saprospiraceae bacterium]
FLVDVSGSMKKEQRLLLTKEAIRSTMKKTNFASSTKVYISAFDNDISPSQRITKGNVDKILENPPFANVGSNTDLFRAVVEKTEELNKLEGRKVMILISNGDNDVKENPYYKNNEELSDEDVMTRIKEVSKFKIYPIGIGDELNESFLSSLASETGKASNFTKISKANEMEMEIRKITSSLSSNYKLVLEPNWKVYRGEIRELNIKMKQLQGKTIFKNASKNYIVGSSVNPVNIRKLENPTSFLYWGIWFLLGGVLIFGLYLLLSKLLPYRTKKKFEKKYVKPFMPKSGRGRMKDPITLDVIEKGELVVQKCDTPVTLNSWNVNGYCPNYPDCMNMFNPCDGRGGEVVKAGNFFDQQGDNKVMNWLWFGVLGGFIAWFIYVIFQISNATFHVKAMEMIFSNKTLANQVLATPNGADIIKGLSVFANDILIAILLSTAFVFTLSWVEESNGKVSWGKIILRTLLGSIIASLIFFSGILLQYLYSIPPVVMGFVTWGVLGLSLGFVLSTFNSSIRRGRGMISGLIAGILAFAIYFLIGLVASDYDGLLKLFSFMIMGGLFGYTVISVISRVQDYELETLYPVEFNSLKRPIGKWLENNTAVDIGRASKCLFYVKWNDSYVVPKHAKITSEGGTVYIEALAETLVDGVILPPGKQILKNGAKIKLGRNSNTILRFNALMEK